MIRSIGVTVIALALWAAPTLAQDAEVDSTAVEDAAEVVEEAAEQTAEVADEAAEVADDAAEVAQEAAEVADDAAAVAEETAEIAEEVVEAHDWEFALSATDRAPGASGEVRVTEGDPENSFVLEVAGLPAVDELDEENRDVNAYTVWIVPSKDQVPASTLGGVLNVDPESGQGTFESTTSLDTFGVIVSATVDGAPASIGGIPVLTGIPVSPAPATAPAAEPEAPAMDDAAPAVEAPAEEPAAEPELPAADSEMPEEPAEDADTPPAPESPGR